jgi:hypothetical protein
MVGMMPVFDIVVVGNIVGESVKVAEFHPEFTIILSVSGSTSKNISPCLWERFVSS